jgi:hypothetical protein
MVSWQRPISCLFDNVIGGDEVFKGLLLVRRKAGNLMVVVKMAEQVLRNVGCTALDAKDNLESSVGSKSQSIKSGVRDQIRHVPIQLDAWQVTECCSNQPL